MGIEPTTYSLGSCRSTTELRPHFRYLGLDSLFLVSSIPPRKIATAENQYQTAAPRAIAEADTLPFWETWRRRAILFAALPVNASS
jgi:hypothetical protein